jgi:hypothetical protein
MQVEKCEWLKVCELCQYWETLERRELRQRVPVSRSLKLDDYAVSRASHRSCRSHRLVHLASGTQAVTWGEKTRLILFYSTLICRPSLLDSWHFALTSITVSFNVKFFPGIIIVIVIVIIIIIENSVGTAMGYGQDGRRGKILSSPQHQDLLRGPSSLLSKGYRRLFPGSKTAGAWSWSITSV